jgi:gluconate kinase
LDSGDPLEDDDFVDWLGRNGFEVVEQTDGRVRVVLMDEAELYKQWNAMSTSHAPGGIAVVAKIPAYQMYLNIRDRRGSAE